MGKVYKQAAPVDGAPAQPGRSRVIKAAPAPATSSAPSLAPVSAGPSSAATGGRVLGESRYDGVLRAAESLVQGKKYAEALQSLLDLEVTRFYDLRPHELLAEAYLHLGETSLAQEQCTLCADILAREHPGFIRGIASFEELIGEAGDPATARENYKALMEGALDREGLFEGTKIAFHLAAHRMNEHDYKEAEAVLSAFRERYLALASEE